MIDEKNGYAEAAAAALITIEEEKVAEVTQTQARKASDEAAAGEAKAKAELALATAEAALEAKQAATIKAKGAANKAALKLRVAQPYPKISRGDHARESTPGSAKRRQRVCTLPLYLARSVRQPRV